MVNQMKVNYDFSGWVTKNNIKCSDGRIIRHGAFKDNDGRIVPLVWNHQHNDPSMVVGHILLENRDEGTYGYGSFNSTQKAVEAKECVVHGDVTSMSIYANQLKQSGSEVLHGNIREVSLVLAGANPGATIDAVILHSDDAEASSLSAPLKEDEFLLCINEPIDLNQDVVEHADTKKEEPPVATDEKSKSSEEDKKEKTLGDIYESLTDEQKKVVQIMIGMAVAKEKGNSKTAKEDESDMKHNVFDNENENDDRVLSHSDIEAIFSDAKRYGSLKESAIQHGIDDIEWLFPEAKSLEKAPSWIKRNDDWVSDVMKGVGHTPFSRIKTMFADITEADARAKGYIKGNRKVEEVFGLLKRSTSPTTIYKKQKLDRDDVIDITDFDVIAWLKAEMRMMLDEEIARAILVGDGRNQSSDDWINTQCIRPIWTDDDLFTIKKTVVVPADATPDERAKLVIRAAIKARKDYKGSGNPVFLTTEDLVTDMLLIEDGIGRTIYDSVDKLATKLRVSKIITVPVMENLSRQDGNGNTLDLMGIIVNLDDYKVGADKGGAVNMFDDFDIDYNAMKYLIETRCSGALVKPYSAIALEVSNGVFHTVDPEDPDTTVLGKAVSDLQDKVLVHDTYITGTLKYVTGYTGFSGDPEEQSGNYLALKFEHTDGATTTIQLSGSDRIVELDSDMQAVVRVTSRKQKLFVKTTKSGAAPVVDTYSLNSLRLMSE